MRGTRSGIPPSELDALVRVSSDDAVECSLAQIAVREESLFGSFAVALKELDAAVGHAEFRKRCCLHQSDVV